MKLIACPSPNFEDRTDRVQFIIIHATGTENLEKTFDYLIDSKPPHRVSAHYVIDRDGTVYALVEESKRAWHAGLSDWQEYAVRKGTNSLNDASIGIELQCPARSYDEKTKQVKTFGEFTTEQILTCLELCRRIMKRHKVTPERILRHSDVSPERKFDPGATFPWAEFKNQLTRK